VSEPVEIGAAVGRVEALLNDFAKAGDPAARARAEELVRVLLEVYGAGLLSILNIVRQSSDAEVLLDGLAEDKLVASLLLVHGLHPVDTDTRIVCALARMERRIEGCRLIFDGLEDGTAKIRVEAADGHGAGLAAGLHDAIEQIIRESAPDVDRIEIGDVPRLGALVQIAPAQRG